VLRRLAEGPCAADDFRQDIVDGLIADGLVTRTNTTLHLPE
jgi:hypothetical protein